MYREKDLDLQVSGNLKVFEQHLWLRRRETGHPVSYLPWYTKELLIIYQ
jgi:hypothetical protein